MLYEVITIAALGKTQNGQPVTEETNWVPSKKNSGYSEIGGKPGGKENGEVCDRITTWHSLSYNFV